MTKVLKMARSRWMRLGVMAMFVAMFVVPSLVHGATLPEPTIPVTSGGGAVTLTEVEDLIRTAAQFLIVISIIVATIFIIWGGIRWMMARDDEDVAKEAKETIKNGIFGAAIVLGVGVILQTVAAIVSRSFFK